MAWLTGWSYRKEISITGQAGAGTDYQVDFSIGDSAGGDFHLEGNCTNFPQDIAVTDNDGDTELDYWIEDITADPIKMWVEVADDLGSNQTIYIYYGKSGATTSSNIETTFLFGEHFPGDAIDTDKWDGDTGDVSVSGSILYFHPYAIKIIRSKAQFGADVAIRSKIKNCTGSNYINYWGLSDPTQVHFAFSYANYVPQNIIYVKDGTTSDEVNSDWPLDSWNVNDINVIGGTSVTALTDGVERTGSPVSSNPPDSSSLEVTIAARDNNDIEAIECDWIIVRQYQATEPAFSSAGAEETPPVTGHPWFYERKQ